jgi:hypothetical protein
MAVTLNASTSSGFIQTADTSGIVQIQSNGTTGFTVDSTGAYGQVERGTAVASTSGTSIDFTGLPSWVKRVTVMLDGVSTNGTSNLQVQLGDSGGIETSGYTGVMGFTDQTSPTYGCVNLTTGVLISSAVAAGYTFQGQIVFCNLNGNTWSFSGNTAIVGIIRVCMQGGSKTLSATLDRVRITTVNGTDTFDAGTINILYEG